MSTSASHLYRVVQDGQGNVLAGATVTVCNPGTQTAISESMFSDRGLSVPLANPFVNANGAVDLYLAAPKTVALKVEYGNYVLVIDNLHVEPNAENLLTFESAIDVTPTPVPGWLLGASGADTLSWVDPTTLPGGTGGGAGGGTGNLNYRGLWQPGKTYETNDVVHYGGALFIARGEQFCPRPSYVGGQHVSGTGPLNLPLPASAAVDDLLVLSIVVDLGMNPPHNPVYTGYPIQHPVGPDSFTALPMADSDGDDSRGGDAISAALFSYWVDQDMLDRSYVTVPDQSGMTYVAFGSVYRDAGDFKYFYSEDNNTPVELNHTVMTVSLIGNGTIAPVPGPEGPQAGQSNARGFDSLVSNTHFMAAVAYSQVIYPPEGQSSAREPWLATPYISMVDSASAIDHNQNNFVFVESKITALSAPRGLDYETGLGWEQLATALPVGAMLAGASMALGEQSEATDQGALAMGYRASANGPKTLAIGWNTSAEGDYSTAIGNSYVEAGAVNASAYHGSYAGSSDSLAMGSGAYIEMPSEAGNLAGTNEVGAYGAVAIGRYAGIYSEHALYAIAIGDAEADGPASVAIGYRSYVDQRAIAATALGPNANAYGNGSVAIGGAARDGAVWNDNGPAFPYRANYGIEGATADGADSIAIGGIAYAYGDRSIAIGRDSSVYGLGSVSIGESSQAGTDSADHATALGASANAQGLHSVALGYNSLTASDYGAALGPNAWTLGVNGIAIGRSINCYGLNSIYIGRADQDLQEQSNQRGFYGVKADNGIALGNAVTISTGCDDSIALGSAATVGMNTADSGLIAAPNAIAIGNSASTLSPETIALGHGVSIAPNASNSIALGQAASVASQGTVALGYHAFSSPSAGLGVAIGYSTYDDGQGGNVLIGGYAASDSTGFHGVALGFNASVAGSRSISIGETGGARAHETIVLGYGAIAGGGLPSATPLTDAQYAIAIGSSAYAGSPNTIAVGQLAYVNHGGSDHSIALGHSTSVTGHGAVALGTDASGNGAQAVADNEIALGTANHTVKILGKIKLGAVYLISGTGSPAGVVSAPVGSLFLRSDGGANTSHYVKESGTGSTGWTAK